MTSGDAVPRTEAGKALLDRLSLIPRDALATEIRAIEAEAAPPALDRERLAHWIHHDLGCGWHRGAATGCDCGLSAAREEPS